MTQVTEFKHRKQFVEVLGNHVAYLDEGSGNPIVFLHGNPTSSYLWRNIIPFVSDRFRVVAPDLIGMGDSDKPNVDYRLETHARFIEAFLDKLKLTNLVIVAHDWGSAIGMWYARRHSENVRAIALMEPIMPPHLPARDYAALGGRSTEIFQALQTPALGEELIYRDNFFVEEVLGGPGVVRGLSEAEMTEYRRPFLNPKDRTPTLQWPREMPIGSNSPDVANIIAANGAWYFASPIPKLFFFASPGALMPASAQEYVQARATNLKAIDLGHGTHFLQEDHAERIGAELKVWLSDIEPAA